MRAKSFFVSMLFLTFLMTLTVGCSEPISKREQGGLLGLGVGAGTGAIIGSTVGHAAVGALIGGPLGLIAGALIGDQLMGQDRRQDEQQSTMDRNRQELERLKRENQQLRQQAGER
jgi:outer membrane lipoprotein SlyB